MPSNRNNRSGALKHIIAEATWPTFVMGKLNQGGESCLKEFQGQHLLEWITLTFANQVTLLGGFEPRSLRTLDKKISSWHLLLNVEYLNR